MIGPSLIPLLSYILILLGVFEIFIVFIRAYTHIISPDHNPDEIHELDQRFMRNESSSNSQNFCQYQIRNSYTLLTSSTSNVNSSDPSRRSNVSF